MNIFIVSVLLAAVYLTACSSHRATSRKRTSFVTGAQFKGICGEIVTLKQQNIELQNKIDQQNIELQNKIDQQNIELQNKIAYLEQSITGAG